MFLMNKLTFRKAARKRKCIAPLALILKQLSLQLKNSKAVVFIFHLSFCDVNKINANEGKLISVVCKNSKREKENTIRPVREEIKSGRRARVRETEKSIACWMRIINQLTLTQNAWRWCVRALFFSVVYWNGCVSFRVDFESNAIYLRQLFRYVYHFASWKESDSIEVCRWWTGNCNYCHFTSNKSKLMKCVFETEIIL